MPSFTLRSKSMPSTVSRKPWTKCCRDCSPSATMSMPASSCALSQTRVASRFASASAWPSSFQRGHSLCVSASQPGFGRLPAIVVSNIRPPSERAIVSPPPAPAEITGMTSRALQARSERAVDEASAQLLLHPDLKDVLVRRLRVHHVDALQLDPETVLRAPEVMAVGAGEMPELVASQLDHVEARAHVHVTRFRVDLLDHDVRDDVVRAPVGMLGPGVGMRHALHPHRHHVAVLGEDRRRAVPGRV